jgi:hypothetical protein
MTPEEAYNNGYVVPQGSHPVAQHTVAQHPVVVHEGGSSWKDGWAGLFNGGCAHCGPQCWVSGEYLYWKIKDGPLSVPLVASSVDPTTTNAILGDPDTVVLFGNKDLEFDGFSGGRVSGGYWINPFFGLEASGFLLQEQDESFRISSDATGFPVLSRPIIDAVTGAEYATGATGPAAPGQRSGAIAIDATSQLWGAELNAVGGFYDAAAFRLEGLAGVRYLGLEENLQIADASQALAPGAVFFNGSAVAPGSTIHRLDEFEARNHFYGGQIGLRGEYRISRFGIVATGKVAFGVTHQILDVSGTSSLVSPGGNVTAGQGGYLALAPNLGKNTNDEFTIVPEFGVKLYMYLTENLRVSVGYDFLYWNNVIRPGDQINRAVNPGLSPSLAEFGTSNSPAAPFPLFRETDFWAQGLNFGLEFRF